MNSLKVAALLLDASLVGSRRQAATAFRKERLMLSVVTLFLLLYLLGGYLLFEGGLLYIQRLAIMGDLIIERALYLIFFFFFLMLVFSNAIIGFSSLFLSRETSWLLSLPIPFSSMVTARTIETLVFSSWGLVVLSAPIFAAFAQVQEVSWTFFPKMLAVVLPFIAIPACLGTALLLVFVRFYRPWWRWAALAALATFAIWAAAVFLARPAPAEVEPFSQTTASTPALDVAGGMQEVLGHTSGALHPMLPSGWVAEAMILWSRDNAREATFASLLVLSYGLMGLLLTHSLFSRLFYPARSRLVERSALRYRSRSRQPSPDAPAPVTFSLAPAWLPLPRLTAALVWKDFLYFVRDPSQWSQFLIIFGLLLAYTFNLRNLHYDLEDPFWQAVISYLNFGACSLAVSTLTTRFIFPQFSLEGRRVWILGLAPFSLSKIFYQKFWASSLAITCLTLPLMLIAGDSLQLSPAKTTYFLAAIALSCAGLNAIALSLGTLFPNLREPNPAKIVSGFGGTLCLVMSFLYILASICLLVIPSWASLAEAAGRSLPLSIAQFTLASLAAHALITVLMSIILIFFATRHIKTLDNLAVM